MSNRLALITLACGVLGCGSEPAAIRDLSMPSDDSGGSDAMPQGDAAPTDDAAANNDAAMALPFGVSMTAPLDQSLGVPITAPLQIVFTQPIDTSSLMVTLSPSANLGTAVFSAGDTIATFTPPSSLANAIAYTMTIAARDKSGTALASPVSILFTTVAAPDLTPPTVIFAPAMSATNVPLSTVVTLTFSKPMNISTVGVVLPSTLPAMDLGPPSWSNNNSVLSFPTPATPLQAGIQYSIVMFAGATDLVGNAMAKLSSSFTTVPPLPLIDLLSTFPNPNNPAEPVATNSAIVISFNQPMNPATVVDGTSFKLMQAPSTLLPCTCSWGNGDRYIKCSPNSALNAGAMHIVQLATTVTSAGGTPLTFTNLTPQPSGGFESWSFTSSAPSATPPDITLASPTNGQAGVSSATPIELHFSQRMDPVSTQAAFSISSPAGLNGGLFVWPLLDQNFMPIAGTVMKYYPPGGWPNGATVAYTLGTGALAYLNGQPMAAAHNYSFSVAYSRKFVGDANFTNCSGYVYGTDPEPCTHGVHPNPPLHRLDVGYFSRSYCVPPGTFYNVSSRGSLCFPLPEHPVTRVISATLHVNSGGWTPCIGIGCDGNLPARLGHLNYDWIPVADLTRGSYTVASAGSVATNFSTAGNGEQQAEIAPLVSAAVAAGAAAGIQIRLRFDNEMPASGATGDGFYPDLNGTNLDVRYESTEGPNDP